MTNNPFDTAGVQPAFYVNVQAGPHGEADPSARLAIHERFSPAYGPASGNNGWYAMDVEFKFDDEANPNEPPTLYIKQARPYPGRGAAAQAP
ncbi:hypothetical protein [Sorangium sp. So ce1024]|uniref:hypothetical protein n=1 Tax=unclassified Sorangium TaxID=2621164 RepID=UPI003EFEB580